MSRKVIAQPATPEKPYVKIQRRNERHYAWHVIDPADRWGYNQPDGITCTLKGAQRQGERALRRYLRKKGYQQESWTVTLEADA